MSDKIPGRDVSEGGENLSACNTFIEKYGDKLPKIIDIGLTRIQIV